MTFAIESYSNKNRTFYIWDLKIIFLYVYIIQPLS